MRFRSSARLHAAALVLLATWMGRATAVTAGEQAPDFQLQGLTEDFRLSALRGKVVYLDFWASWCGPCKQSFPWMNELQKRYGPQGLQVVAVNVDANRNDARRFLAEVPARFSVAFDARADTPRRYDIKGMPTSVLIAPDGQVLYVHSGFRDEERAALESRITQALASTPRTPAP
jgi:thiol-disulfide isomerase/thioredoxin